MSSGLRPQCGGPLGEGLGILQQSLELASDELLVQAGAEQLLEGASANTGNRWVGAAWQRLRSGR